MNTHQDFNDELLRKYINPGMIEKAPPGFTGKVMHMVSLEPRPSGRRIRLGERNLVPVISIAIILALVIAALLLPPASYDSSGVNWIQGIKSVSQMADKMVGDAFSRITLPAFLPYLFLSILLLTFFDRGLGSLFHRHKS